MYSIKCNCNKSVQDRLFKLDFTPAMWELAKTEMLKKAQQDPYEKYIRVEYMGVVIGGLVLDRELS